MICPPCNNHCNYGADCPNLALRKISTPIVYEIFDQLHAEYKTDQKIRNDTLEEVAKKFDVMPFGDTSASFAKYVRDMKI